MATEKSNLLTNFRLRLCTSQRWTTARPTAADFCLRATSAVSDTESASPWGFWFWSPQSSWLPITAPEPPYRLPPRFNWTSIARRRRRRPGKKSSSTSDLIRKPLRAIRNCCIPRRSFRRTIPLLLAARSVWPITRTPMFFGFCRIAAISSTSNASIRGWGFTRPVRFAGLRRFRRRSRRLWRSKFLWPVAAIEEHDLEKWRMWKNRQRLRHFSLSQIDSVSISENGGCGRIDDAFDIFLFHRWIRFRSPWLEAHTRATSFKVQILLVFIVLF